MNEGIAQIGLVTVEEPKGDVTGDVTTSAPLIVPYISHNMVCLAADVRSKRSVSVPYMIFFEEI